MFSRKKKVLNDQSKASEHGKTHLVGKPRANAISAPTPGGMGINIPSTAHSRPGRPATPYALTRASRLSTSSGPGELSRPTSSNGSIRSDGKLGFRQKVITDLMNPGYSSGDEKNCKACDGELMESRRCGACNATGFSSQASGRPSEDAKKPIQCIARPNCGVRDCQGQHYYKTCGSCKGKGVLSVECRCVQSK